MITVTTCRRLLVQAASIAALAACGDGSPSASDAGQADVVAADAVVHLAEATIGPAGGTVESASSGLRLEVPAGALAAETTITVDSAEPPPGGLAGKSFELGPSGTQFTQPVRVRIAYEQLPAAASPGHLRLFTRQDAGSPWTVLPTALETGSTAAGGAVTGELAHFSALGAAVLLPCSTDLTLVFGDASQTCDAVGLEQDGVPIDIVQSTCGGEPGCSLTVPSSNPGLWMNVASVELDLTQLGCLVRQADIEVFLRGGATVLGFEKTASGDFVEVSRTPVGGYEESTLLCTFDASSGHGVVDPATMRTACNRNDGTPFFPDKLAVSGCYASLVQVTLR